jgi:hypothetical protein
MYLEPIVSDRQRPCTLVEEKPADFGRFLDKIKKIIEKQPSRGNVT